MTGKAIEDWETWEDMYQFFFPHADFSDVVGSEDYDPVVAPADKLRSGWDRLVDIANILEAQEGRQAGDLARFFRTALDSALQEGRDPEVVTRQLAINRGAEKGVFWQYKSKWGAHLNVQVASGVPITKAANELLSLIERAHEDGRIHAVPGIDDLKSYYDLVRRENDSNAMGERHYDETGQLTTWQPLPSAESPSKKKSHWSTGRSESARLKG